jgi:polyribonucleotide nucleotidyltransferase
VKSVKKEIGGRPLILETGKTARQADGAVTVRYGDTVVLVTAIARPLDASADFFPLNVDYRERFSAVGKIPGGFFKREGRPTTKEILTMRLVDRSLRPLFPEYYNHEVQIVSLVFSADQENDPDIIAITGASAACLIGNVALQTAVAGVRVGRIANQFVLNPTHSQLEQSEFNLTISGTQDAIVMVEAGAREVPESSMIDALLWGHEQIKEIIALERELVADLPQRTASFAMPAQEEDFVKKIEAQFSGDIGQILQQKVKQVREKALDEFFVKIKEKLFAELPEPQRIEAALRRAYEKQQKKIVRDWIVKEGKRVDGRGLKDIRPITCEVGLLPRAHGSSLFTRGETQALVTSTLGTPVDEQVIEGLMPESSKRFMLHYNFPPFCVGEAEPMRSPSRRDIGHGALAERALESVLPEEERFPYTIRIVSEILESNGSSSMASVCGGTLSLMDAGVPIKRPVAGVAMGLVKEGEVISILSDIMGTEDHYGDMDFKVAGTQRGITALQMDIKVSGVSRDILAKALEQAREGRIHVLREMMTAIDRPRRDVSPHAPKIMQIKVDVDKIAAIIGPAGKNIRSIQEATKARVDIKDTGVVTIYSDTKDGALAAKELISHLTEEVKVGKIYKGRVTSVKDFGAFVEIMPGTEGLVHVSELEKDFVQNVADVVRIGDEISVKVLAIDEQNRIKLSKRAADRELGGGTSSSNTSSSNRKGK